MDNGRTVVISGGGTGIGRACAEWFAEHGDKVVIVGRRERRLADVLPALGPSGRMIVADLSDVAGAEKVADELAHETVDVVVASAGGTKALTPKTVAETAQVWLDDVQLNLMTAVLLVAALRDRLARPGGRIIGLGSIGAQLGSGLGGSYGAAKAALHAWMYWLAADLGSEGVTANLVLPGYVPETDFWGDRMNEEFDRVRVEATLLKRAGSPREVAATVGFLASREAGYITGQLIGINGGRVLGR